MSATKCCRFKLLVEGGVAAVEHGAAKLGQLHAVRISFQETHTEGVLQFTDRARDDRVRDSEHTRCLRHAPGLRHCEQDVQVAQLDPTPDPVSRAHGPALAKLLIRCTRIVLSATLKAGSLPALTKAVHASPMGRQA